MHAEQQVKQVSHYHGLGKILKGVLRSGLADQVQVETSHRIRRVYGRGRQHWGSEKDGMQTGAVESRL